MGGTVWPSVVVALGGAACYARATMLSTMTSIMGTVGGALVQARLDLRRGSLVGVLSFLRGTRGRLHHNAQRLLGLAHATRP